jgi:hypothetical protein
MVGQAGIGQVGMGVEEGGQTEVVKGGEAEVEAAEGGGAGGEGEWGSGWVGGWVSRVGLGGGG